MKSLQTTRHLIDHQHREQLTYPVKITLSNNRYILSVVYLFLVWWCCQCVAIHLTDDYFKTSVSMGINFPEHVNNESENMVEENDDNDDGDEHYNEKSYRRGNRLRLLKSESNQFSLSSLLPHHHHHNHLSSEHEWNFTQVNLANSHLFYIRTKFSCSVPRAKLIKVLDYHASPSKQYVPRCTVLHRCDDESGCCEDVTHKCEPSKTELVDLYFHVIRSDIKNNITGGSAVGIERLTFLNHTQCECKPINYMPRTVAKRPPLRIVTQAGSNKRQSDGYHKCKHVINCPEPFIQRFRDADQRCVCDCVSQLRSTKESYKQCLDIQAGVDKLSYYWARCVRAGECSEPVCPFGSHYSKSEYRCAASDRMEHRIRHHHRVEHHLRHRNHHHLYHRTTNETNPEHSLLQQWMRQRGFSTSSSTVD